MEPFVDLTYLAIPEVSLFRKESLAIVPDIWGAIWQLVKGYCAKLNHASATLAEPIISARRAKAMSESTWS